MLIAIRKDEATDLVPAGVYDFPTGSLKVNGVDVDGGGGGGTPGGADHDVQLNDGGAFGVADGVFAFDDVINSLALGYSGPGTSTPLVPPASSGSFSRINMAGTNPENHYVYNRPPGALLSGHATNDNADTYVILDNLAAAAGAHLGGYFKMTAGQPALAGVNAGNREQGSFCHGYFQNNMNATTFGKGCSIMGHVGENNLGYTELRVSGDGSHFLGSAFNVVGSRCDATGFGAILLGRFGSAGPSATKYGKANAAGAIQCGNGINTNDDSFAVGADLRLNQDGLPASVRNGDQWVAGGYVYIRSNGASVKIT